MDDDLQFYYTYQMQFDPAYIKWAEDYDKETKEKRDEREIKF